MLQIPENSYEVLNNTKEKLKRFIEEKWDFININFNMMKEKLIKKKEYQDFQYSFTLIINEGKKK